MRGRSAVSDRERMQGSARSVGSPRIAFVDLLRSASVVSIVSLHVLLSNIGQYGRWPYGLAAILVSIFSNETLVFISLLLALPKLKCVSYTSFVLSRFARIGLPFVGFTVFFVVVDALWQQQGVLFKFP